MSNRDMLFSTLISHLGDWTFNEQVAEVFQDMLQRSIPEYSNIIAVIGMLAKRFVQPNTQFYDLGCSLGAAALSAQRNIHHNNCKIIAVDNSSAMVKRCRKYVNICKNLTPIEIIEDDIRNITIKNASMVVMNFTLQFLTHNDKQTILDKIYNGLNENGIFILSEKFRFNNIIFDNMFFNLHCDFKRNNGYSELEINQKRDTLEHVMFTDCIETHKLRLQKSGFHYIELWFQCLNFGSFIALK